MKRLGACALVVGILAAVVMPLNALGQTMPYPEKDCRALADDLGAAGPLPKPYTTEVQWFREGDLGLKGRQCRISARGVARRDENTKARPGIDEIAGIVTRVLKRHGFTGDRLLQRYKRGRGAYRAFALRKDRATCWTNLEPEDVPVNPAGPARPSSKLKNGPQPPVWRLTVDCFLG